MSVTAIVQGGTKPTNRLRVLTQDTTSDDAALEAILHSALSDASMRLYLPMGTDGATGATVTHEHVAYAAAVVGPPAIAAIEDHLQLSLQRTIAGEAADSITIAPGSRYRVLRRVANWIGSLNKGWRVGFAIGDDVQWINPTSTTWLDQLVTVGSLALYGPSINLELVDELDAYGSESTAAELHLYQIGIAAQQLTAQSATGAAGGVTSVRQGSFAVTLRSPRDAEIARLAGLGWMAV